MFDISVQISNLQQQILDIQSAKSAALTSLAAVMNDDGLNGPNFNIGGAGGTKSVDRAGYINTLTQQLNSYVDMEKSLSETLGSMLARQQEMNPYWIENVIKF